MVWFFQRFIFRCNLTILKLELKVANPNPRSLIVWTTTNEFRLDEMSVSNYEKVLFSSVKCLTLSRVLHYILAKGRILVG